MIYGYIRVSTKKQIKGNSIEDQMEHLKENGCLEENIVIEQSTGKTIEARPEFNRLLEKLQYGDQLMTTKLDRLARSVIEGSQIIKYLLEKGVSVHVLNIGLLENTAIGMFTVNTLLAVAELERSMIIERTQAGKEIARTRAGYIEGRPRIAKAKTDLAMRLLDEGNTYKTVEKMTGISKATLIRRRNEQKAQRAMQSLDL